jgi:uncharacterized protein (TIGR03000 family)
MMRWTCKTVLVGVVLVAALAAWNAEAQAYWGCCVPTYSAYYAPSCWSGYYYPHYGGTWHLGWRPGPVRRLLFGPYRWYYGGYGYYGVGAYGYGWAGYDPCCWTTVSWAEAPARPQPAPPRPTPAPREAEPPVEPTPPEPPGLPLDPTPMPGLPLDPTPTPPMPGLPGDTLPSMPTEPPSTLPPGLRYDSPFNPLPGSTHVPSPQTSGMLTIWVPYGAEVTINGYRTQSTGTRRQYVSYGLQPGHTYTYEVVATVKEDGRVRTESKTVVLSAGDQAAVAFAFQPEATEGLAAY